MINVLLVSHGNLANEFLHTAEMIMGKVPNIDVAGIQPGETKEDFEAKLETKVKNLYTDDGILVFADLYGGTPCNVSALSILNRFDKVQVISGLNLSMLLEALVIRSKPIYMVTEMLIEAGCNGIIDINKALGDKRQDGDDE